ncbi:MAG: BadM/Rrf2 family transcriptional regulator [Nitrospirae bacterium]|nr:MAG: BadM/Rrf2 family transcriptional regulator [Nitrospirota bacterium]
MQIKRETDYAIRCLFYLAGREDDLVMVEEIAQEMAIPKSFAAKILQKLARGGLVTSCQGVKGGFRLAKAPEEVSFYDVMVVTEGPLALNICTEDRKSCDLSRTCKVHPFWVRVRQEVEEVFRRVTFERIRSS